MRSSGKIICDVGTDVTSFKYWDEENNLIWHRNGGLPSYLEYYGTDVVVEYSFFVFDLQHRLIGPADVTMYENNNLFVEWILYNKEVNPEEYFAWLEEHGIDINNITPEDEVLIAIEWS